MFSVSVCAHRPRDHRHLFLIGQVVLHAHQVARAQKLRYIYCTSGSSSGHIQAFHWGKQSGRVLLLLRFKGEQPEGSHQPPGRPIHAKGQVPGAHTK